MLQLPKAFLARMSALLKEDYNKFIDSLNENEVKGIFVNENKISVGKFKNLVDFSISPIPYEPCGFYVDNTKRGKHPLHHAGAFYVQDPSAMFTVNALKFKGDERVLDMCAAPGGKTIQIANRIKNGIIVSNEIDKSRSEILYSNVERMGLKNVIITNDTPQNLARAYANCFDVVLVDAPCSGEGMFRRGVEVVNEWNENLPKMCAIRQQQILSNANNCLKQGGYLIYSTCTYSIEENEQIIQSFLKEHNYQLINIDAPFSRGVGLKEAVRLYPHNNRGEGQFVAVLKKSEQNNLTPTANLKLIKNEKAQNFAANLINCGLNLYDYKNYSYNILDVNFIKRGVNYITVGVRAFEIKNKLFLPHHNLFTAFGLNFYKKLQLDYNSSDAAKYLKGETLETNDLDGYGAVLFNNCAVGGYKISASKFKNHYPKGLRNS